MQFSITMQDADAVSKGVAHAVLRSVQAIEHLSSEERDALYSMRLVKVHELLRKWFSVGEMLTVEIDTEAGTCIIRERQ